RVPCKVCDVAAPFFFQAEDGIRARNVTGVQTCALPISRRTLGEVLKAHRMRCQMTQEFVAEVLGVSRQAVSKWETGTADPSTSKDRKSVVEGKRRDK